MEGPPGVGGAAPSALAALWSLLLVTFIFVLLRLYTRIIVIKQFGIDDHCYNAAFYLITVVIGHKVLFLIYNILLQISSHWGFGRDLAAISSLDYVAKAILYEAIGQTLLVFGTAVAKLLLGLFLLRLVSRRAHTIAILVPIAIFSTLVVVSLLVFWFLCQPTAYLWDRRINGRCTIDPGPVSVLAGSLSVAVDLWYAVYPWYLLWELRMPQREKIAISSSMSLGIVAAACGTKRALELNKLGSPYYLKDTVPLIVWHAAELAVTIIGIGIPVCLPLYKGALDNLITRCKNRSGGGNSRDHWQPDAPQGGLALHTIGCTPFANREAPTNRKWESAKKKKNLMSYSSYPSSSDNRAESGECILGLELWGEGRGSHFNEIEGGNLGKTRAET